MSLSYDFKKAASIIDSLTASESSRLQVICEDIQKAEAHLNVAAEPALARCMTTCKGLCCRNIHLDQIIGVADFVFVLTVETTHRQEMIDCLDQAQLFSADCIFLQNRVGPCLFSDVSKPKVCICTFCGDDEVMKKEIRAVESAFFTLSRFLAFRKPRAILHELSSYFFKAEK